MVIVGLLLVAPATLWFPTGAAAEDGLPPGVPVPSWAKGKLVHFEPAEPHGHQRQAGEADGLGAEAAGGTRLKYEGGPVENEPVLMLVFLGEEWEAGAALARRHELEATAEDLPGSGYQKILTQYSSLEGPISPNPLLDSPVIEKYYVKRAITGAVGIRAILEVVTEVREMTNAGWGANVTYAVLPAPGTAEVEPDTCGYHVGGPQDSSVAAIMDTEARLGCEFPSKTLTHEYAESVTDPQQSGWRASPEGENEIADICNYLGPQRIADGAEVAALWDDSKNACEVEDNDPGSVPIGPYTEPIHTETSLYGSTGVTLESEHVETAIYPCGKEAHYYFEYGVTKAYGHRTAEAVVPATWGEVKATATITGLRYSTPYHWRLVVTTSNGVADGGDHEFVIPYYVELREEEAFDVGTTEASLRGEVRPAGVEAEYYFEYGATEAYGSKTAQASAGSGSEFVRVSAPLTGLAVGTLYHYRLVASSSRGTVVGKDHTFETDGGKPGVSTLSAGRRSYTEAVLIAMVDPKGTATSFFFEYGTTSEYGSRTAEQPAEGPGAEEERATLDGLTPDTTYHFRIVATNSEGTSYGADRTFSTGQEPLVETNTPQAVGFTTATLGGTIDPHGNATSYYVEFGPTVSYGERTAEASAGSGATGVQESQDVTGLAEHTTYHFRVVATTSYGTTYGADRTFSTGTQPAAQTDTPMGVGSTSATLTGSISSHSTEVTYFFEYGTTAAYGAKTTEVSVGSSVTSVEVAQPVASLTPGTVYHYRLVVGDPFGEVDSEDAVLTTAAGQSTGEPLAPVTIVTPVVLQPVRTAVNTGPTVVNAFSGLSLPVLERGSSISVGLGIKLAGSRVEVEVTAPAVQLSGTGGKNGQRPVELARLLRPSVGAGALKLTVPIDARGVRALRHRKHLTVTVRVVVTPHAGAPQVATGEVRLQNH
jgi:hypothetical protein